MHFVQVCEFGYIHGQCRCPSENKAVRRVSCDNIEHMKQPKYTPKHRLDSDD